MDTHCFAARCAMCGATFNTSINSVTTDEFNGRVVPCPHCGKSSHGYADDAGLDLTNYCNHLLREFEKKWGN